MNKRILLTINEQSGHIQKGFAIKNEQKDSAIKSEQSRIRDKMFISQNFIEATRFCETGKKKGIFAEEVDETGRRQFLVTKYNIFTEFYLILRKNKESFYEVLNGDVPLKGYWDLDCFLEEPLNMEEKLKKEEELVNRTINQISKTLSKLGKEIQSKDFLVMRAENPKKISIHLILNGNVIFKNNKEIEWITNESFFENGTPIEGFETSRKGVTTGIVDKTVYCQRQNFRILWSTKKGKRNPLVISPHDKNTQDMKEEAEILQASLIQNLDSKEGNVQGIPSEQRHNQIKLKRKSMWETNTKPEVKDFLQQKFNVFGGKWKKLTESTILLATEDNEYCENVERRHKSNNIYLLYNIKAGIMYKKCHKCVDRILKQERIPAKIESIFRELARKL